MVELPEKPKKYNLGWYRRDVATAGSYLVYVLVPDWLGSFAGTMEFERISASGLPLPEVRATAGDLASPRRPEDTEGVPLHLEQRLIRALQLKAGRAKNTLPEIVPTTKNQGWSKMPLDEKQRKQLLRAGGIE